MKIFLEHVAQKVIPPAVTEVLGDLATKYYEGCVILRIVDHRNVTTTTNPEHATNTGEQETQEPEPKTHNTVLQPTPSSLWHDLLYATDQSPVFPDQLAIAIESEFLKFSVRNIDLRVPADSTAEDSSHIDVSERPQPGTLTKREAVHQLFCHRRGIPRKRRKQLHEDNAEHGSELEQLMLIMDERPAQPPGAQFLRLSAIEEHRRKLAIMSRQLAQSDLMRRQSTNLQSLSSAAGAAVESPVNTRTVPQPQADLTQGSQGAINELPGQYQPNAQVPSGSGSSSSNSLNSGATAMTNDTFNSHLSSPFSTTSATPTPQRPPDTTKTRGSGKATRPRATKTSAARGASSIRGRGKADSKNVGSRNTGR